MSINNENRDDKMNEKDKELMEKYPDLYEIAKSQVKVG